MKLLIIVIGVMWQTTTLFAQKAESYIHQGNKLYQDQKFKDAEAKYLKSVEKKEASVEGNFNLGDAFYKQKKFEEAGQQFNKIAASATDEAVKAKAYHNLGNTLLQSKKLEESVAAYKKSLIANPKDDQTRYNLAYAQEMLKKQQEQKQKQDKNKDQNKDQDQQNKDKQDQDKKDKDKQDQNKDQGKQNQDQKDKDDRQGQQPEPNKLSKEDAERMLEALNNNEQQTQDKLKNQKLKGVKKNIDKDW